MATFKIDIPDRQAAALAAQAAAQGLSGEEWLEGVVRRASGEAASGP